MVLLGKEKIYVVNLITLSQIISNFGFLLLFFFAFKYVSVLSYVFVLYFASASAFAISFIMILKYLNFTNIYGLLNVVKDVIKYGGVAQLGNVIQYLNYRLSYYILNYFLGASFVGIYSVGIALSEAVWLIGNSIAYVQYAKISNTKDLGYARDITVRLSKFSFIITFTCLIFLLLIPSILFTAIFGRDFGPVKEIMFYLSPGIASFGLTIIISHYFAGIGKYYENTIASLIGLIVTVAFSFLLIPKYGYIGASIAASLSYIATSIFLIFRFFKETKMSFKEFYVTKKDINFMLLKLGIKKCAG